MKRDKAGNRSAEGTEFTESFMQIRINEQSSAERLKEIGSESRRCCRMCAPRSRIGGR